MSLTSIIGGFLSLFNKVADYLFVQDMRKAGRDEAAKEIMEKANERVNKALNIERDDNIDDEWLLRRDSEE